MRFNLYALATELNAAAEYVCFVFSCGPRPTLMSGPLRAMSTSSMTRARLLADNVVLAVKFKISTRPAVPSASIWNAACCG